MGAYRVLFEAESASSEKQSIQPETEPAEPPVSAKHRVEKLDQTKSVHPKGKRLPLRKHIWTFGGVIGFLFVTNMMTSADTIWFHWPALGWGLLLYLHWIKQYPAHKDGAQADSKLGFRKHLGMYAGVVVFLFIVNIITSPDYFWVQWPGLGWGLFLFMHWVKTTKL